MSRPEPAFLFNAFDSRIILSTRYIHLRRVYDIFHLSLLKHDLDRATRAWAILARCPEFQWMKMWTTALNILDNDPDSQLRSTSIAFLRDMMTKVPAERENLLKELIIRLILAQKYQEALEELELYLPSFPYQDNPILHTYAGLICLYLSQPSPSNSSVNSTGHAEAQDTRLLSEAKNHFKKAESLESNATNSAAAAFLTKIERMSNPIEELESDDERDSRVVRKLRGKTSRSMTISAKIEPMEALKRLVETGLADDLKSKTLQLTRETLTRDSKRRKGDSIH